MMLKSAILVLFTLASAALWCSLAPDLRSWDGSSGLTLFDAASWPATAKCLALGSLASLVLAALAVKLRGDWSSGMLVLSGGLVGLAGAGGPIDGWLRRNPLPASYAWLMAETLLWLLGLLVLSMAALLLAANFPPRSDSPTTPHSESPPLSIRQTWPLDIPCLLSALTSAALGAGVAYLLIRNSSSPQVIASLLVAFAVAGLIAHSSWSPKSSMGILLSPAVTALGAYAWGCFSYPSQNQLLAAWYSREICGLMLALPLHYLSAGVAGSALGIAWAQYLRPVAITQA
ncbi:MAG: hypothetical protein IT443_05125 [Phycisphaeraceae bacterium]|nr:hypothetical protein [Phycisphaeraceae bacterium]